MFPGSKIEFGNTFSFASNKEGLSKKPQVEFDAS